MIMDAVPSPKFVLRGHKAAVHATAFARSNARLVTGDSEGFVVVWDLTVMRPKVVWRAHENAILGIRGWGDEKIITHGRDHKLIVWKLNEADESGLSSELPLEPTPNARQQPWIVHLLQVNTMNFCSFAACSTTDGLDIDAADELLIAVPNTLASEAIDIYALPSQRRIHTVHSGDKNGMAMCLSMFHRKQRLNLVSAFENGHAAVHQLQDDGTWALTYRAQAHSQPILSLDVQPDIECFFTSGADAVIAKHPIPDERQEVVPEFDPSKRVIEEITDEPKSLLSQGLKGQSKSSTGTSTFQEWKHPTKTVNTKHSGQQSLRVRSDGAIFATAGWDSKMRIYSTKTLKELAVLKWHNEGAYAVAFSSIEPSSDTFDVTRMSVSARRSHRAKIAHWVAAGAKDGKVSLWDVY